MLYMLLGLQTCLTKTDKLVFGVLHYMLPDVLAFRCLLSVRKTKFCGLSQMHFQCLESSVTAYF